MYPVRRGTPSILLCVNVVFLFVGLLENDVIDFATELLLVTE